MLLWIFGIVLYTIRFTVPVYFKNSIAEDHVWYFTGTGAAMILLAVLQSEIAREILRHRVLIFLGRISYSTYLFHFSVLLTITPATLFMLNRFGVNSPLACWTVGILATTVATIAVATVAHGFIEVPSIRLGKIFSRSARAPSLPAGKGST